LELFTIYFTSFANKAPDIELRGHWIKRETERKERERAEREQRKFDK
jgi:hypothetical protein